MKNLKELLRKKEVQFLAVQETLISGDVGFISNLIWKHSTWHFCQTPSTGRLGGLLCIWDADVFSVDMIYAGNGYLGVEGLWQGCSNKLFLCNIYGPQDISAKKLLWDSLLALKASSSSWWCLMGDFNVVRYAEERLGSTFNCTKALGFNSFIDAAELLNPPLGGRRYTYCKSESVVLKVKKFKILGTKF